MIRKFLVSGIFFLLVGIGLFVNEADASAASVFYNVHGQTYGDQSVRKDGQQAGTTGKAKRLEAIQLDVDGDGGIKYQIHGQTYGWQKWVSDDQQAGTKGRAKRAEAIKIELTGNLAKTYDVYYRVHGQTYGWQGWKKNGEIAGTTGKAKRLEALEVKLVAKPVKSVPVTGITGSIGSSSLTVGDTTQITTSVSPMNATDKKVSYTSSNNAIATVDATGLVKALAPGSATITAQSTNGKQKSFGVTVKSKTQTPIINLKQISVAWGSVWDNSLLKSGFVSGTDEHGNPLTFEKLVIKERNPMNTKKSGNYIYDVSYGGVMRQIWVKVEEPVYDKSVVRTEMLRLVNELRASVGSSALVYDPILNEASDIRADELTKSYMHVRPNGEACLTVLLAYDPEYLLKYSVAENIGSIYGEWTNQELAQQFFDQWKKSPGHYKIMIDPAWQYMGFSFEDSELCSQQFFSSKN